MSKALTPQPKALVHFVCLTCSHKFKAVPERIEDTEERPWHPYDYYCTCEICRGEAVQAPWQINLWKAHAHATGPRSAAGKAASAKNLEGHPTPEEAQITRFNAMTHGATAKVARHFPARPGKYEICDGCEHLNDETCVEYKGCLKRAEINLRYQIAFSSNNPTALMDLHADRTAALHAIIDEMIYIIAKDGTRLKAPEMYYDKEGSCHVFKYFDEDLGEEVTVTKYTEHPLLKRLFDAIGKIGLSMVDMGMTPKGQEETNILKGHLAKEAGDAEKLADFQERQTKSLEGLRGMIENSHRELEQDDVLQEFNQEDGNG